MEKLCTRCNLVLHQSEFNWKIKGRQLAAYCKICSRAYVKSHYDRNQKYYIDKARKRRLELKVLGVEYVGLYLEEHPCIDCGEEDIMVLEFDHKERKKKTRDISQMLHTGFQLEKIIKEIKKCEVRCANCHRRKTHKENQSWKTMYCSRSSIG